MNFLRVRSLYFVKGLNYEGPPFSLLTNEAQSVTVFPKLCVSEIEPYAISSSLGNSLMAVMAGGLPGQPTRQKLTVKQFGQRLVEKFNEDSNQGAFVQISNRVETGIGLTPLDSISKSPNQTTSHPTPTFNSDCGRHIRYCEKDGLITGFLQNELDQELTSLEKKDADALAIYLIKNKTAFSANKITTAISIEAGPIDVWLNQIKASVSMEQIFYLNDVDSMVEYFYSHSELSDEIDGLLLMQSLGYNTKTPYVQFMSLWVVLEKIINKSFKRLSKERILDVAKKKNSLLNKRTVGHIKDVDNGFLESVDKMKFNIMDRLLVSTSAAGIELDDETISLFKQTKKTRDGLHSSVSENGSFPTESIYKILRRVCG